MPATLHPAPLRRTGGVCPLFPAANGTPIAIQAFLLYMHTVWLDLRHAARQLRRSPAFSLIAIAAIALGIGANTAIFTVIDAVLLNPLPYPDSGRIVTVMRRGGGSLSMPEFTVLRQEDLGLDQLTAFDSISSGTNLTGGDRPHFVHILHVSRNYFRLLGATPLRGRTFTEAEDRPGGGRPAVIGFGLWQSRFAGRPDILGRQIELGGVPYTITGVLGPSFQPYPAADLWLPLQPDPNSVSQAHLYQVEGRLPSGITLPALLAHTRAVAQRYVKSHPAQLGNDDDLDVRPMREALVGDVQPALLLLAGAVALVLLIACANVANLLLARSETRHREIAIRSAIGAGRARIVRQLLTESLLLAAIGAALGLVIGNLGLRALLGLTSGDLPRAAELASAPALDARMLAFTLAAAAGAALIFGLLPALRVSRIDLASTLKESSGRGASGRGHARVRNVLAASEMALAVVLLSGASLLVRSFAALHNTNPGLDPRGVLEVEVSLSAPPYRTAQGADRLTTDRIGRIERLPGVESAAVVDNPPFTGFGMDMIFNIPGRPLPAGKKFLADVQWRIVSSRYFSTLRIPLVEGRLFTESETTNTVIVNRALARKYWPGRGPVGQQLLIGANMLPELGSVAPSTVIGVVGDTREQGLDNDPAPTLYQLYSQAPSGALPIVAGFLPAAFLIRTRTEAPGFLSALDREFVSGPSPLAPIRVRSMDRILIESTARTNFLLALLGVFAALALLLASVGIYGVLSYTVEQRRREIGIRSALGATNSLILRLIVGEGLRVAVAGVVIGLAAAFALSRVMRSLLYGVQPWDPLSFALAASLLLAVAFLACWVPARRAARLDPIEALRDE